MELDEFKAHWNTIQDKEFQQQQILQQKIEQIMMNTTDTLGQLHSKSVYWRKMGKAICQVLLGVLAIVFLITLVRGIYHHSFSSVLVPVTQLMVLVLYSIVTMWVYNRQEQIFTLYNNGNVKETLKQTITAFKRFYVMVNSIYLFLYPASYYAVIKLLMPYWHLSSKTIFITCTLATVISLIAGHWYYKVKFFNKLRSLEENLKYLES